MFRIFLMFPHLLQAHGGHMKWGFIHLIFVWFSICFFFSFFFLILCSSLLCSSLLIASRNATPSHIPKTTSRFSALTNGCNLQALLWAPRLEERLIRRRCCRLQHQLTLTACHRRKHVLYPLVAHSHKEQTRNGPRSSTRPFSKLKVHTVGGSE